jgi:hypothetical protein
MGSLGKLAQDRTESSMPCRCQAEKIRAVHGYLKEHFPQYGLRDFHAPTRLMHAGLPAPSAEHHVVSLEHDDILPYYAVLLSEFLEEPLDDVCADLRRWEFAATLRAHRIAIVSQHGASAL